MYVKTQWVNNTTPIDENNLNKIEQGIYDNSLVVDAVTNTLNPTDTTTYKTAELTEGQITDVIGVNDILIKGDTEQDGTPTPSAPVDVNVVSGSNIVSIQNRYANLAKEPSLINYNVNSDGLGISNGFAVSEKIYVNNNTNFYYGLIKSFSNVSDSILRIGFFDENNNFLSRILATDISANQLRSVTIPNNTKYLMIGANNGVTDGFWREINKVYYGFSSTIVPHQGKELPLDLGSIELCKIGDYQDYFYKSGSKWYLHKEEKRIKLDGSENWSTRSSGVGQLYETTVSGFFSTTSLSLGVSNQYVSNISLTENNTFRILSGGTLAIHNDTISGLDNFKNALSSSNLIIYYPLATATNTEITDTTLISQLEAIYNAPLYEQTNITQTNNDLPMVLDITACKDNINGIKAFIRK